jgi:hypothetical protein
MNNNLTKKSFHLYIQKSLPKDKHSINKSVAVLICKSIQHRGFAITVLCFKHLFSKTPLRQNGRDTPCRSGYVVAKDFARKYKLDIKERLK